ncbi:serine carboxypeptidase [Calocera cornea HHB12733]|uniref:carboxypeptidase C n=1 Tax=Calocera cornea HHB12733 TaxID=1353952 RepID=A0A165GIR7_9BASI|nr:serine carboxypeptidase [Calocera cornea HHB12733]
MRTLALLLPIALVRAALTPLPSRAPAAGGPSSCPAPGDPLCPLSTQEYITVAHDGFREHALRIRETTGWCDPDVRSWTGYLDINGGSKHLFFYFFESRCAPSTDPLLMYVDGGPGCSGALGLFMELGPCSVNVQGTDTVPRSAAWNERVNVIFLDQPVGAGWSHADYEQVVDTTEAAAVDVVAFVRLFLERFQQYKGREFHMTGKSYAGRYLPVFAGEILDQNKRAAAQGMQEINLKSIMIGNGHTDYFTMLPSRFELVCTGASVPPILDVSQCVRMKRALPRCLQMTRASCVDRFDELGCKAAKGFCSEQLEDPFVASGRNIYDISKECEGSIGETLCYPITTKITDYLNLPSTRNLLGVDDGVSSFELCANKVWKAFNGRMDIHAPNTYYVANLLERGISILNFAGTYDWACNWIGNMRWVEEMEWSGREAYNAQPARQWFVDGQPAGITKSWKGMTFATIDGAGHLAPHDKPVQALALANRWLAKRAL